jgi:O-antigen/teichoic acid export membrane protein
MSAASGTALLAVMVALSHLLVRWLGNGAIDPGWLPATLTALLTGVFVFEQTISKAILPALGRVSAAARATAIGGAVGLAAVVIGLQLFGVAGAMAGVLCGVIVRAIIGLRASRQTGGEPVIGVQAGELV